VVANVCSPVVKDCKIPKDWSESWVAKCKKGKGDALECGSYRGIKMLEYVLKIFERIIKLLVGRIKIANMRFGFMGEK